LYLILDLILFWIDLESGLVCVALDLVCLAGTKSLLCAGWTSDNGGWTKNCWTKTCEQKKNWLKFCLFSIRYRYASCPSVDDVIGPNKKFIVKMLSALEIDKHKDKDVLRSKDSRKLLILSQSTC
jgi:hypothetical protein